MQNSSINNFNELEFTIFCIENVASFLGKDAASVYAALKKSNIVDGYIVPEYEVLHTQGKEYIVADIIDMMNRKNVKAE